MKAFSKDKKHLQETIKSLEASIKNLSAVEKEKATLEDQLSDSKTNNSELQKRIEEFSDLLVERDKLDRELQASLAKNQHLVNENASLSDRHNTTLNNHKEENSSLQSEIEKLKEDLLSFDSVRNQLTASLKENELLSDDVTGLKEKISFLTRDLEDSESIRHTNDTLKEALSLLEQKTMTIQKELGNKVSELSEEKKSLIEEVVLFQDEITRLKAEINAQAVQKTEVKDDRRSSEREMAELRLRLLSVESEKRNLESEVKEWKEKSALGNSDMKGPFHPVDCFYL